MRSSLLFSALLCAAPAVAQNWYIPDPNSATGTCNVIPYGSTPASVFANCKYQTRCTVADLGGVANLITGLAFASCNTGRAHYDALEIVLDHIPPAQPLSTTFASNLTANAVTVLNATNYTWNVTANVWNEVGLQTSFVYNGVDDLLVQVTTTNGAAPGGFHRGTRERLQWFAVTGPPPAAGTLDLAASKIEVSMLTAHTSSHGDGCLGSNGIPRLAFSGSAVVGNTLSFDLTLGVPGGVALFIAGFTNGSPFPLDLGFLGAPGCFAYTDLSVASGVFLDPVGSGNFALPIPLSAVGFLFYGQFAVLDPPANAFGFTTSNYGRVLTGT